MTTRTAGPVPVLTAGGRTASGAEPAGGGLYGREALFGPEPPGLVPRLVGLHPRQDVPVPREHSGELPFVVFTGARGIGRSAVLREVRAAYAGRTPLALVDAEDPRFDRPPPGHPAATATWSPVREMLLAVAEQLAGGAGGSVAGHGAGTGRAGGIRTAAGGARAGLPRLAAGLLAVAAGGWSGLDEKEIRAQAEPILLLHGGGARATGFTGRRAEKVISRLISAVAVTGTVVEPVIEAALEAFSEGISPAHRRLRRGAGWYGCHPHADGSPKRGLVLVSGQFRAGGGDRTRAERYLVRALLADLDDTGPGLVQRAHRPARPVVLLDNVQLPAGRALMEHVLRERTDGRADGTVFLAALRGHTHPALRHAARRTLPEAAGDSGWRPGATPSTRALLVSLPPLSPAGTLHLLGTASTADPGGPGGPDGPHGANSFSRAGGEPGLLGGSSALGGPGLPGEPSNPGALRLPGAPSFPGAPGIPGAPGLPGGPGLPNGPSAAGGPSSPDGPSAPGGLLPPELPSAVHRLTGGNPLAVTVVAPAATRLAPGPGPAGRVLDRLLLSGAAVREGGRGRPLVRDLLERFLPGGGADEAAVLATAHDRASACLLAGALLPAGFGTAGVLALEERLAREGGPAVPGHFVGDRFLRALLLFHLRHHAGGRLWGAAHRTLISHCTATGHAPRLVHHELALGYTGPAVAEVRGTFGRSDPEDWLGTLVFIASAPHDPGQGSDQDLGYDVGGPRAGSGAPHALIRRVLCAAWRLSDPLTAPDAEGTRRLGLDLEQLAGHWPTGEAALRRAAGQWPGDVLAGRPLSVGRVPRQGR